LAILPPLSGAAGKIEVQAERSLRGIILLDLAQIGRQRLEKLLADGEVVNLEFAIQDIRVRVQCQRLARQLKLRGAGLSGELLEGDLSVRAADAGRDFLERKGQLGMTEFTLAQLPAHIMTPGWLRFRVLT